MISKTGFWCFVAGLALTQLVHEIDASEPISAQEAVGRLAQMKGKGVRVVLEDIDGTLLVAHALIAGASRDGKAVRMGRPFDRLPGTTGSLYEEYCKGQESDAVKRVVLSSSLRAERGLLKSGRHRGKLVELTELDTQGPPITSAPTITARQVDDGFVSQRAGEYSDWEIVAKEGESGKARTFRLLNSNYRSVVRKRNARIAEVKVEKPAWRLNSRRQWEPAVRFVVTYDLNVPADKGWFVLNQEGLIQSVDFRNYKEVTRRR